MFKYYVFENKLINSEDMKNIFTIYVLRYSRNKYMRIRVIQGPRGYSKTRGA